MNILVIGAAGLIGSAICARLSSDAHHVVAAVRGGAAFLPMGVSRQVVLDLANATSPSDWLPHLEGIDAVVNCAGALQDTARDRVRTVHVEAPAALFVACEEAGIRRVVHFSALGVDREQPSEFSQTKALGDDLLMARELDWVILRPSVVLGPAAYGASALFRGVAALPVLPLMPHTGQLQVVQLSDVVETVVALLQPTAPSRLALELVGPERLSFADVVATYRRWLGSRPAPQVNLPSPLSRLLYKLGDLAGHLGWRPPMRSNAQKEITRGAVGDAGPWLEATGIRPMSLAAALASRPPSVQERWFAKLYFLKPLTFIVLPLFWIATGIISLTNGFREGVDLMLRTPAAELAVPAVIAGALADIAIGAGIAFRRSARWGLYGGIGLSLFYAVAGSLLLPALWDDPLGPLLKIWPILVLHLLALAVLEDR
ncbi:SDR family oxidoreductase [Rhizobium halophilum]|uniref:SDR family oxidoreductase n=1 Tax=Rhizobium halophilum TaxID=2846852 RepID=UPI001EFC7286|nr:SDR family oxidoreductase [Rhizobium halophilum]MCF6370913.1 SDR family oxidoreductase [Rhizobium halophilum]